MKKATRPEQGLGLTYAGGRPREEDILTRRKLPLWDRIKWLLLLVVIWLILVMTLMGDNPLIGFLDSLTQAGALASISPNYNDNGARAGKLAAEILARPDGRRIPVPPPVFAPGNLTLNLQTAKALGVTVSDKSIGAATQVIR